MTTGNGLHPKTIEAEAVRQGRGAPLLDRLPDDVTLEDIQYHLDVVMKVLEAEASLGSAR